METSAVGRTERSLVPADLDLTRRPPGADRTAGWLLARAARAGDTVVSAPPLVRALAGTLGVQVEDPAVVSALEASVTSGEVVVVPDVDSRANRLGLAEVVAAEDALAEHVERLLVTAEREQGGVVFVPDLPGARPPPAPGAGDGSVVVHHAERLGLARALELLAAVPDGGRVVLVGDPQRLAPAGPGRFLADLLTARVAAVHVPEVRAGGALTDFATALRTGTLVTPGAGDRSVVVVPAGDDAEVVHRVGQLLADSIPRTFGIGVRDILVLTPLHRGVAGRRELSQALAARGLPARVATVADAAADHAAAVVLALPAEAAGVLHRALLVTAATRAERHLSIVSAVGECVRAAVARGAGRRPRTRLAELLTLGD